MALFAWCFLTLSPKILNILFGSGLILTMVGSTHGQIFDLSYTLDEELAVGSIVGNIGRDSNISNMLSQEDFKSLSYRLLAYVDTEFDLFYIDARTGLLHTSSRLDRESQCQYDIKCQLKLRVAAETSYRPQFYTFKVTVELMDVNDNSPVFFPAALSVPIAEDAAVGTTISITQAIDPDQGVNGIQHYHLDPTNSYFNLMVSRNLDGSLVPSLYVTKALDREEHEFYYLTVVAIDGGIPPRKGELRVNVTVRDVNDNVPRFLQRHYEVNVTENTPINTVIEQLEAEDMDTGLNGEISFRLGQRQNKEHWDLFKINSETGQVVTSKVLIPYQNREFQLIVEAIDKGAKPLVDQAVVNIYVKDSVNNAPMISMTLPTASRVSEKAQRGSVVAHFIVSDTDAGQNGEVMCSLDPGPAANAFNLQRIKEAEFKVMVYSALDRETLSSYEVAITCTDTGNPRRSAATKFSVELDDANEKPQFIPDRRFERIAENSDNSYVLRVQAQDEDVGQNSLLSYSLGDVTSLVATYIQINSTSGEVTLRRKLDRELFSQLEFYVIATDAGEPPLSSSCLVLIEVLDVNDNYPQVPAGYGLYVSENRPPGTIVGQIEAIDPDQGLAGLVTYQLEPDNEATHIFTLTPEGLLRTLRSFDREHRDVYDINVVASDSWPQGRKINLLHIRVYITDENDHEPEFRFPSLNGNDTIRTTSDGKLNATLGYITARDPDAGENGTLTFTVLDDGGRDLFRVDPYSGRVYTSRDMRPGDEGRHILSLFVRDSGVLPLSKTESLKVVVLPGNASLSARGTESDTTPEHYVIIILVSLVAVFIVIALCVFVVVARLMRRYRRANSAKHAGGLSMDVKNSIPLPSGTMRESDTYEEDKSHWKKYEQEVCLDKSASALEEINFSNPDDAIMLKLKMVEIEPQDKEPYSDESVSGGGMCSGSRSGTYSNHRNVNRMCTFKTGRGQTDKVWRSGVSEELLSSSSYDTSGGDSGRGVSEDGANDSQHTEAVSTTGNGLSRTIVKGDNANHASGFERPPVLKTFQSDGIYNANSGANANTVLQFLGSRRDATKGGCTTGNSDDSNFILQHRLPRQARQDTICKTVASTRKAVVSCKADRPQGFQSYQGLHDYYENGCIDDTTLKRLVIHGLKTTEDDNHKHGYSQQPSPPPIASSPPSPPRDMRLCSEPPVSPFTKLSFWRPQQESNNTIPKLIANIGDGKNDTAGVNQTMAISDLHPLSHSVGSTSTYAKTYKCDTSLTTSPSSVPPPAPTIQYTKPTSSSPSTYEPRDEEMCNRAGSEKARLAHSVQLSDNSEDSHTTPNSHDTDFNIPSSDVFV